MLFVLFLASILLKVDALRFDDLFQPGPEPGAGKLDLLPGQLVEHDGDPVLQLSHGVTGRPVGKPFDRAL